MRRTVRFAAPQLAMLAIVCAAWFWFSREGRVSPILLPQIERVVERIPELLSTPATWRSLRLTILEIAGAFGLSVVTGVGVGFLAGRTTYGATLVGPVIAWFQTVPIILLYPICILLFGIGAPSKIVFAGLYGFFPMAYNTIVGLRGVESRYLAAARSMGASDRDILRKVMIPAALPVILSGVRLGAALNLIGVLAGEILASRDGLGYQIAAAAGTFQIPDLYAYIIVALVLVALFNAAVTRAEDRGIPR